MSGEDEDVGRRQRKVKEVLDFDWKLLVSSAFISLSLARAELESGQSHARTH